MTDGDIYLNPFFGDLWVFDGKSFVKINDGYKIPVDDPEGFIKVGHVDKINRWDKTCRTCEHSETISGTCCNPRSDHVGDEMYSEDSCERWELAENLRKKEQSKGCPTCQAKHEDWSCGGAHDVRVHGDTLLYFDHVFGWEGVKIAFCPMCGRDLGGADHSIHDGEAGQ